MYACTSQYMYLSSVNGCMCRQRKYYPDIRTLLGVIDIFLCLISWLNVADQILNLYQKAYKICTIVCIIQDCRWVHQSPADFKVESKWYKWSSLPTAHVWNDTGAPMNVWCSWIQLYHMPTCTRFVFEILNQCIVYAGSVYSLFIL